MAEKKRFGEIISKCWSDTAFKQRFLTDPKTVLAEFDIEVPEGLDVKVVENTDNTMYLTLPTKPPHPGELSDDQLDNVSGGTGMVKLNPAIVKFRTKVLVTSALDNTCSQGKECIPW